MSVTQYANGSQTCTVGTEHFLSSPNVPGVFTLVVDSVNNAAGDVFELRVYKMVLTSGTQRVIYFASYYGPQPADDVIKISVPVGNALTDTNALRFSIKQTFGVAGAGAGRVYPWAVEKY